MKKICPRCNKKFTKDTPLQQICKACRKLPKKIPRFVSTAKAEIVPDNVDPTRKQRIRYYAQRASKELPLFSERLTWN